MIEIVIWREPGSREWHARVIDGVSRGGVAMAAGDGAWEAVASALAGYAELTRRVPSAPPVGTLQPTTGERRQRRAEGRRSRRRLEDIATSATRAKPDGNQAAPRVNPGRNRSAEFPGHSPGPESWWADVEHMWRVGTRAEQRRLSTRAHRLARRASNPRSTVTLADQRKYPELALVGGELAPEALRVAWARSARWASDRARAMAMARHDVLDACAQRWRTIRCDCGPRELPVGCAQVALCARCSVTYWRRWKKRIRGALELHTLGARKRWAARPAGERSGMRPGIYLVTLTVPHDGGIAEQRAVLGRAWRGLTKIAHKYRWWSDYAATFEATPGSDGRGHVHLHVAAISSWIPYEELHAHWRRLAPGAVIVDVQAPRADRTPKTAANYLAKYVTKGVEPSEFTGALAGELLVANRGKRRVLTSVDFWQLAPDPCRVCGAWHRQTGVPVGLQAVAPAGVIRGLAEVEGYWLPRGPTQGELW
jgi:hypothetical protein